MKLEMSDEAEASAPASGWQIHHVAKDARGRCTDQPEPMPQTKANCVVMITPAMKLEMSDEAEASAPASGWQEDVSRTMSAPAAETCSSIFLWNSALNVS